MSTAKESYNVNSSYRDSSVFCLIRRIDRVSSSSCAGREKATLSRYCPANTCTQWHTCETLIHKPKTNTSELTYQRTLALLEQCFLYKCTWPNYCHWNMLLSFFRTYLDEHHSVLLWAYSCEEGERESHPVNVRMSCYILTVVPSNILGVQGPQLNNIHRRLPWVRLNHPFSYIYPLQLRVSSVGLYGEE